MKNIKFTRGHIALYLLFLIYFIYLGSTSFLSKYYGEIGITDFEIGIIYAAPAFVCVIVQPLWGAFSDSTKYKRNAIILGCALAGILFIAGNFVTSFIPLLIIMTLSSAALQTVSPVSTAISLEYVDKEGGSYGFIRLLGTVSYQLTALIVGFILSSSLHGLLMIIGIALMLSALVGFTLPPIEGHQHGKEKMNYFSLLKDKRMVALLAIIGLAEITNMFSTSFLGKLQSNLGISNSASGIITVLSIILEVPFLFFGERLYKKLSIWKWLLVAILVNGLRWFGYAYVTSVTGLILIGIPSVTCLACFEFFPALYIDEITGEEMKASAQSILVLVGFGVSKIFGSLVGGAISERIGIQPTYFICGIIMMVVFVGSLYPCYKMDHQKA